MAKLDHDALDNRFIFGDLFGTSLDPRTRLFSIDVEVQGLIDAFGVERLNAARDPDGNGILQRALVDDERHPDSDSVAALHRKRIELLLDAGLNPNQADGNGRLPIHLAAQQDGVDLDVLLQHGADVHAQGNDGDTAMHWAAVMGRAEGAMQSLLDYGADVNALSRQGDTPLAIAVRAAVNDTTEFLLDRKADPTMAMTGQAWKDAEELGGVARGECMDLVRAAAIAQEVEKSTSVDAPTDAPAPRRRMRL